jgi:hypothetical protein
MITEEDGEKFLLAVTTQALQDTKDWPQWMREAAMLHILHEKGQLPRPGTLKMWGAYRCSTWHHYGESPSEKHEQLIDADTNAFELVRRVNAYYAREDTIRSERGVQHVIEAFQFKSKPTYRPGGGGTDYTAYIEIRELPMLNPDRCEAYNMYADHLCDHGGRGCNQHPKGRTLTPEERKAFRDPRDPRDTHKPNWPFPDAKRP